MTVRDAIQEAGFEHGEVEYRTYGPTNEEIWTGSALYDGDDNTLVPCDGDSYYMDDVINKFEKRSPEGSDDYLVVWYESKWIMPQRSYE